MYSLQLAQSNDIAECFAIIETAKRFQREQGFIQWTDDYPNMSTIQEDLKTEKGYVLLADHEIAGYLCIDFSGEPAYENITGKWHTKLPYAVIHRMALHQKFRSQGLSRTILSLAEHLCLSKNVTSIRVDTDFQNKRMQHVLEKGGFSRCGTVVFQGSEKLAYDKSL